MSQVSLYRRAVIALTVLCAFTFSLTAQSDLGTINGIVKDQSGAVVPNATVTVKNEATGTERRTTSSDAGVYTVSNIPAGNYSIIVTAAGFKKFDTTSNKLDPSSTLEVNATLTVGAATETVEVSATAQQLQTESASVQKLVTREQIDALELNGRNPIFMANLVPGTRGGNLAGLSFNFTQGPSNINGARTPESLITYDGAPAVRTRSNGTSIGAADVDSTQEIQILTADYAAEYGRSSGGQIRIITKSGGQQFHGAGYEYVRNTVFNANTWTRNLSTTSNFTAPVNYNQYGFNIGGPAYIPGKFNSDKSKFFWYWGTEWVRYRFTDSSSLTVPSLAMRQGNFSELLNPANTYYGKVITIKDPTTGAAYPNNIIPASALSPNGLGILKAYPAPNLATPIGSTNWIGYAIHPQNQRKDTLAVDLNLTDKQRVQFRRNNYLFDEYQPLDGGTPYTPKFFNRPNQTNSLDHVWTISPRLVNEALVTVSLDDVGIPVDSAHFLDRTTVGINYPYIFPVGKTVQNRIPTVNWSSTISGLSGGPYPSHSSGPIYTISDSLTWIKGSHTLKFGFYFERSGENDGDEINVSACPTCTNNQNGQFAFSDTRSGNPSSGNAIANAALGLFDTYSELGQRAYTPFRGQMYEGFAQDSWKVSAKLHVDIGVRYTINVPYSAQWRNMIVFDPKYYDPAKAVSVSPSTGLITVGAGDRYNGMVIPGTGWPSSAVGRVPQASDSSLTYLFRDGKTPSYFSDIQKGNIAPRLGIAYQWNEKTVVRVGGGRFFTRLGVSDSVFLGGNPPFQPTANVSFGKVDNPGGTSTNVLPLTVTTQSKAFKMPEAWNWNVTLQRELPFQLVSSVAYVGRVGLHQQREADINQPTIAAVLAAPAGTNIDSLRPYKGYNSIRETDNIARSRYDSLQLTLNKRFSKGSLFGISYTYSKSYDNGSNQRDIIPDTYDASNLWGPSEFDVRNVFIANYLYDLPFFKNQNLSGKLLGGWQLSGIVQWQTGTPSNVGTGNDYAGVGVDGSLSGIGNWWVLNGGTPAIIGQFAKGNNASDPAQYFAVKDSSGNPLFTAPAKGTFNLQKGIRDLIHNPGFDNWNAGLFKKFAITERISAQFRAEAFDVLNHPNWGGANFNPTSGTFGKITGKTGDVRNMQLSLRLQF
jgi:hypothetical protein